VDQAQGVLDPAALEHGELGQGDDVVGRVSCGQAADLVAEADLLEVLERRREVGRGGLRPFDPAGELPRSRVIASRSASTENQSP
jgi:hypothetical protein